MIRAYDEIVDFIAQGTTPQRAVDYQTTQATRDHVADLLHRERTVGLAEDEKAELDHYLHVEHIMRLAKVRARALFQS